MNQSFCFVLTPLDIEGELPIELIPSHFLARATSQQVTVIKEKLTNYFEPMFIPHYEFDLVKQNVGDGFEQQHLPNSSWRYFVINYAGTNLEIQRLDFAASLLKDDVELGFHITYYPGGATGFGWSSEFMSSFFKSIGDTHRRVKKIETEILKEISSNHTILKSAETESPGIYRAVVRYNYLKALPRQSLMLVIAYFSIIESLIAHKPRLHESLDSINHQLQSKLILLSKKFQRRLDYSLHFGAIKEDKIWKKLYAYRSTIVHDDGLADFDSEFKALKGKENILTFMNEVVKFLLFALKEPVFLTDLKHC